MVNIFRFVWFVCYRLAPIIFAIVPDPRFFSFFKVNDGSVVAKEERASLLVDQECVGFVKEGLWAEAAQGHLAHRSFQLTDGTEFHLEDMVLPRTSWLQPPCIPHRECRPSWWEEIFVSSPPWVPRNNGPTNTVSNSYSLSSSPSAPSSCIWIRQRTGDLEATERKRSAVQCRGPWTPPPPRCPCWPAIPGNKLYVLCVQVHLQPSLQLFKGCYARGESQDFPEK